MKTIMDKFTRSFGFFCNFIIGKPKPNCAYYFFVENSLNFVSIANKKKFIRRLNIILGYFWTKNKSVTRRG